MLSEFGLNLLMRNIWSLKKWKFHWAVWPACTHLWNASVVYWLQKESPRMWSHWAKVETRDVGSSLPKAVSATLWYCKFRWGIAHLSNHISRCLWNDRTNYWGKWWDTWGPCLAHPRAYQSIAGLQEFMHSWKRVVPLEDFLRQFLRRELRWELRRSRILSWESSTHVGSLLGDGFPRQTKRERDPIVATLGPTAEYYTAWQ